MRAGRSGWYDRHLRKAEAAGSNPARSTKPSLGKEDLSRKIELFIWFFKT